MVGGFAKAYNLPFDYVLYDISYTNMVLFGAVLPSYHSAKDKAEGNAGRQDQEIVRAGDAKNNDKVRELISKMV